AARGPPVVRAHALLSTACTADSEETKAGRQIAIEQARTDFPALADRLARAMLSRSSRADAALLADTHAMILRCGADRFAEQQAATATRVDRCDLLPRLAVPATILAGAQDAIVAPDRSREMAEVIPDATLAMVPECGHVPQREAPDVTRAMLLRWRERMTP
ncbi:alpha/beta fold hydrolase, partial [Sphingopyxis sp. KK2]|uniref:alpha/beta fold hydrolase n=1 Tax=Sphingopyxis sp. KK2 TaxID=1855727 RepID=UPI00097E6C11